MPLACHGPIFLALTLRHQWLDQLTPDEIFAQIRQARKSAELELENYDEVIE
jgi:hypothetical protein